VATDGLDYVAHAVVEKWSPAQMDKIKAKHQGKNKFTREELLAEEPPDEITDDGTVIPGKVKEKK
jgi:hypothetical protein